MKTRKREGDTTQEQEERGGTKRSREKVIKAKIIKKEENTHRTYNKNENK